MFFSLSFLSGEKRDRTRWQRQDLVKRGIIGQERSEHQPFPGLAQGNQIDLQKGGDSVVMIETQSISIRDSDQEKVKNNLDGGKVSQEPTGDEPVIDPTEGAFDLSDSVWTKKFFDTHGPPFLVSMMPLSFRQGDLSIEFCISRQEKVLKR
jgi:hypothetical protein